MKESNFQFTDPCLTSMEFRENRDFSIEKGKEIEIQTEIGVSNTKISENEAVVKLKVNLGDENAPFYLETIFMAKFKWNSELEDSKVNSFLNQNAPALLLSYARPIISMITNASRFPAYNIPFINFADAKNKMLLEK